MNIKDYTFNKYLNGECEILDSHIHIGLIKNAAKFSNNIKNYKCISYGVIPSFYFLEQKFATKNLFIGTGYHPWYIEPKGIKKELEILLNNIKYTKFIGEIGLDFSDKYKKTKVLQINLFKKICIELSKYSNKVVSIHCVKASNEILTILNETNICENNIIILHWFNGSLENLQQAKKLNCYFSCGPKMLKTKNGYNIIKNIPENKLFLETDIPWDTNAILVEDHFKILNDLIMKIRKLQIY